MPRMNAPDANYPVWKHKFKWAKINKIYTEDDTADIEIIDKDQNPTGEVYSKVPIFYHCEPDVNKRANGALEGSSSGFAEGDKVIVKKENEKLLIVGHIGKPKACSGVLGVVTKDLKLYKITIKNNKCTAKIVKNHPFIDFFREKMFWNQEDFKLNDKKYSFVVQENLDHSDRIESEAYIYKTIFIYNYEAKKIELKVKIISSESANSNCVSTYAIKHSDDWKRIVIVRYSGCYGGMGQPPFLRITNWIYDYNENTKKWELTQHYTDELNDMIYPWEPPRNDIGSYGMRMYVDLDGNVYVAKRMPRLNDTPFDIYVLYNIFERKFYIERRNGRAEWTHLYKTNVQFCGTKNNEMVDTLETNMFNDNVFYCNEATLKKYDTTHIIRRKQKQIVYTNLSIYEKYIEKEETTHTIMQPTGKVEQNCNDLGIDCDLACCVEKDLEWYRVSDKQNICDLYSIMFNDLDAHGNINWNEDRTHGVAGGIYAWYKVDVNYITKYRMVSDLTDEKNETSKIFKEQNKKFTTKGYDAVSTIMFDKNIYYLLHREIPIHIEDDKKIRVYHDNKDITNIILDCTDVTTGEKLFDGPDDINCLVKIGV